jgi:inosose dehydratase
LTQIKLAAAPISWGVSETPSWGLQLRPDRVLSDMRALGLSVTEAGPPGFLPTDAGAARELLSRYGMRLVGGFVTAVLHDASVRQAELASVGRQVEWLASAGADVLVLAPATGRSEYSATSDLSDDEWRVLLEGLDTVAEIADRRDLITTIHPHFGTVIERHRHVMHFLYESGHLLCLDTGHLALGGADPLEVARIAGARVRHVHLKDLDGALADRVREGTLAYGEAVRAGLFRPLGEGVARIADVLEHLKTTKYRGWSVLEQDVMLDREPADPPSWVARSIEFVRKHG